jgi:hypothetical protein
MTTLPDSTSSRCGHPHRKGDGMRKTLLLACVLVLAATMAWAQVPNGSIGIFADNGGVSCNLPSTGSVMYYFVHVNAVGATASQWAAPKPACLNGTRITDIAVFAINFGNTNDGITIGYPTCKTGTFHIMTVMYSVTTADPCCYFSVVADPNLASGKIEIPDCDYNMQYGTGGQGILNSSVPTCDCNVPTESTTWGQMKALYAE